MLAFLDGDPAEHGPAWLAFGGRDALASYGVSVPPDGRGEPDWEGLRGDLVAALPERHLAFLRGLRLSCRWGPYLLVHAGVLPGVPLERQSPRDLLWIREPFLSSTEDHGAIVVHGHVPAPEPVVRRNRIGVDTKAWRSGRLTAAVLGGAAPRFLHTSIPAEARGTGNDRAPAPSQIHGA
jgi:serine/threonine protein phosphatase 1